MTAQYLGLALVLALTLNNRNRLVRATGTLLAAIALGFVVLSVILADADGTFAAAPAGIVRPLLLNAQAAVALTAIAFLLWAAWAQAGRQARGIPTGALPWRNDATTFGLVSRGAHWATATLVLSLFPIGLFLQTLPTGAPDRGVFLAVHQTLGVTVLVLVLARLGWLARSAPPPLPSSLRAWERSLARLVHPALYASVILLASTGLLLSLSGGAGLEMYGWTVRSPAGTDVAAAWLWPTLHNLVLPILFYAIIALHLGAVLKHHFVARRTQDVRRMLR